MFLSIIIPVLNEAIAVQRLFSTHVFPAGVEVILVDGGSSDDTRSIAPPFVRVISSPKGRAKQMNEGARHAKGHLLLFLHVDSELPQSWLQKLSGFWQSELSWGRFDVRLSGRHPMLRVIEFMMNKRSRYTGIATGDQGIFVRTLVFRKTGGFPDIPLMEDIEMSARLRRESRPYCISDCLTTSSRRWENGGVIRTMVLMWILRLLHFVGYPASKLAKLYR